MTKKENHDKSLYEQQEKDLSQQSNDFLKLLTNRGLLEDSKIENVDIRKVKKEKNRNMYHNTLLLLKHYRDICWMIECFPSEISEELDDPFIDLDQLLNLVDTELGMENRKLENRLMSLQKTRLMIDRLNEALTVVRKKPIDGEKMFNVLYYTYIAQEHHTHIALVEKLGISSRQYYRYREQAVRLLSIRLWSAPSVELDSWLEVLSLLENSK